MLRLGYVQLADVFLAACRGARYTEFVRDHVRNMCTLDHVRR
jgi:hypothetical protein